MLIRNARLADGTIVDIRIEGEHIAAMGHDLPAAVPMVDAEGALALPAFVEGHTHLDKTFWGAAWYRNEVGPRLIDRIENERATRRGNGLDPLAQAERLALDFLALGTTRIRSFADVDTEIGIRHVEALVTLRERLRGLMDIQVVAFPQSGLLIRPTTLDLLEAAMQAGADVVGGLDPAGIDRDPKGHLDAVFDLCSRFRAPLDVHLHEPGELGAFSMELIIERTRALSMQGRVVISHAFCLGDVAPARAMALYDGLAEAGIALATTAPPSRAVPSVKAARAAGVTIFGGNDGIRDAWTPYGAPDMLQRAMLIGLKNEFRRDDEIALAMECVTTAGAIGCGFEGAGIATGDRADLVLLPVETVAEAVVGQPRDRLVISHGRIVAQGAALMPELSPAE